MASYGSQHELPSHLLVQKGYHGFVVQHGDSVRLASPWEFAASLGFEPRLWLPADIKQAWRCMGNAVSVAHTALLALRAHFLLQHTSPFSVQAAMPIELVQAIRQRVISLSMWKVEQIDEWERLQPHIPETILNKIGNEFDDIEWRNMQPVQQDPVQNSKEPQLQGIGRNEITPTLTWKDCEPTEVDSPHDTGSDIELMEQEVLGGRMLFSVPMIVQRMLASDEADTMKFHGLLPCVILHKHSKAAFKHWVEKYANIFAMIQTVLPHVEENMIHNVALEDGQGEVVTLRTTCKGHNPRILIVDFVVEHGKVYFPVVDMTFSFKYDCTWKVGDICAMLANSHAYPS